MNKQMPKGRGRIPQKFLRAVAFCAVCIALNTAGSQVATMLSLPIYLDSMGTVLAAMIGGYIPGIVVGYITNLAKGLFEVGSIYYGIVNVVIACITAYLAERGWFKKLSLTLYSILIISFASGALGALLSFLLNGGSLGNEISSPLAQHFADAGIFPTFTSQVIAEFFTNFVDKALVVLSITLLYQLLPESFLAAIDFIPWQQAPLSKKKLADTMSHKPRGMSLETKVVILVATIVAFVSLATISFSYITYHKSLIAEESRKAEGVTTLMETVVEPERVDEFLAKGENAPGYLETESRLSNIRNSFNNVEYVYVYQIKNDGCHAVFDPDTPDLQGSDPGSLIPFDESFSEFLPSLLAGEEIEPVISNDTYGWLLSIYRPLKNKSGETVCYLAADISMDDLRAGESSFLAGVIALFAAFFILVCAIVLWLSRYGVIVPINSISHAANSFMIDGEGIRIDSLEPLKAIKINTGDEIENLYTAIQQMAQEAVRYIDEAQEKSDTISRMQSNLIMVMADIVESRDKFTGDHVRNTATYARIIMNQMRREGICPDILTNEFISNVYQSAPLHDIGKIAVSDLILNKPGRLTDEEFEIMKSHTIAGQEILEGAKSAVSESSYLDEAQRLAAYHHEKWNGTGYPYGLAGEEIPLSARIMAVADVFDALVSKRSYKAGFPVEKAFAIIEEGIGTHFDPQVARAFLHARDRAIAVVEKTEEKKRLQEEAAQSQDPDSTPDKPAKDASQRNGGSDEN